MLLLTKEDITNAPTEIQTWLLGVIGVRTPTVARTVSPETTTPDETTEQPGKEEVLRRAADFLKSNDGGTAKLKAILDDMGLARVKECPDERLAELLAKIAVA